MFKRAHASRFAGTVLRTARYRLPTGQAAPFGHYCVEFASTLSASRKAAPKCALEACAHFKTRVRPSCRCLMQTLRSYGYACACLLAPVYIYFSPPI